MEELKYLWILFTSEVRVEHEADRWICAASAVMQTLYQHVVVKKKKKSAERESKAVNLLVGPHSHLSWVVTKQKDDGYK